jgi:hypothetical protein
MDPANLQPATCNLQPQKGQAALSVVLMVGGIVLLIGVGIALVVISFLNTGYGFQAGSRALAAASAGARDALLQLNRDKDFSSASYAVPIGSYSATVSVTQNSPTLGKATILSTATVSRYERRIQAILSVDAATGQVDLISWQTI